MSQKQIFPTQFVFLFGAPNSPMMAVLVKCSWQNSVSNYNRVRSEFLQSLPWLPSNADKINRYIKYTKPHCNSSVRTFQILIAMSRNLPDNVQCCWLVHVSYSHILLRSAAGHQGVCFHSPKWKTFLLHSFPLSGRQVDSSHQGINL